MKPGWVRLSLPYYAAPAALDFVLFMVELVADHGEAFVPVYRLGWRDGVWRHIEADTTTPPPLALTREALLAAARCAPEPEPEVSEATLTAERRAYLDAARALALDLEARWRQHPPTWDPPTGDPEVDALRWFRYVHAD